MTTTESTAPELRKLPRIPLEHLYQGDPDGHCTYSGENATGIPNEFTLWRCGTHEGAHLKADEVVARLQAQCYRLYESVAKLAGRCSTLEEVIRVYETGHIHAQMLKSQKL